MMKNRTFPLLLLAVAILAWLALRGAPDGELVTPVQKSADKGGVAPATPSASEGAVVPPTAELQAGNDNLGELKKDSFSLFSPRTWVKPPPVVKVVPPKPVVVVPTAPKLPFVFMGVYQEGSTRLVILNRDNRVISAKEGDTIDGVYRLESAKDNVVHFTYLPLNEAQQLSMGSSQ